MSGRWHCIYWLSAILACGFAGPSAAVDVGDCLNFEDFEAGLKNQGLVYIARMNKSVSPPAAESTAKRALALAVAPDLSEWYLVEGSAPLGQPQAELCLKNTGRQLDIFNYHRFKDNYETPVELVIEGERKTYPQGFVHDFARMQAIEEGSDAELTTIFGITFEPDVARQRCAKLTAGRSSLDCKWYDEHVFEMRHELGAHLALHGVINFGGRDLLLSIFSVPEDDNYYAAMLTEPNGASFFGWTGTDFAFDRKIDLSDRPLAP